MLVYHPAYDSYHCLFRAAAILEVCQRTEAERLRVLDFCLSFPAVVAEFRLPQGRASLRKAALQAKSPYRDPISSKSVFVNLGRIQAAAFSCLSATGLVSVASGFIYRTEIPLPKPIKAKCEQLQNREKVFFDLLLSQLVDMPLYGPDGLKARSGLLEYRYDTV
ncbi:ABC-three component system middle component 5 [Polaromonas sp.]|uniref:ABC-three component system middle component 5 n=1 Tax=Polaromonas sp. TaxID=1869339 RepID=UPI003BA95CBA